MANGQFDQFNIHWIDSGKEPQCAPDPLYPEGIDLDCSLGQSEVCKVSLPYPAKRIGYYAVKCLLCNLSICITTAGRPDDPRSVLLACKT